MRQLFLLALTCFISFFGSAQKIRMKTFSIAFTNTNTAMPLNKFTKLVVGKYHPGMEAGLSFNWNEKPRHDWFQNFQVGYFFHRFVQHGIPIYTETGYRYKWTRKLHTGAALGLGYMHAVPATTVYKLNRVGEYVNGKGIGRPQAMASFTVSAGYTFDSKSLKPLTVFTGYQQRIQFPFVKSYVPMLPYNSIMAGVGISINRHINKH